MEKFNPRYALIPAVLICRLCKQEIPKGTPFAKIIESSNTLNFLKGITTESWAHPECIEELSPKMSQAAAGSAST